MKFYEILPQFFCHSHPDRHRGTHTDIFQKLSIRVQDIPKCKSIKNWKSKIFTKPIFSSVYVEKSKKEIPVLSGHGSCISFIAISKYFLYDSCNLEFLISVGKKSISD